MRTKLLFIGIALAGAAMFGAGFALRVSQTPPSVAVAPRAKTAMLPSASLIPFPERAPSITKEELLAKLRLLSQKFDPELYAELREHGPSIQRWLAEILLEEPSAVAAALLRDVATADALPFVRKLIASGMPDDVAATLVELLIRLKDREAYPAVADLLMGHGDDSLKLKALDYLATVPESAPLIARFLGGDAPIGLRRAAADALAAHDSVHAARLLLEVWGATYDPHDVVANAFIIEAFARIQYAPDLLRGAIAAQSDPSRKNVLISAAAMIGGEFAAALVEGLLATETHPMVRRQAILVLGALGTAEAQEKLFALLQGDDFAAAADALLKQEDLKLDRAKLAAYFAGASGLQRSVAAVLLSRDMVSLAENPELLRQVLDFARAGLVTDDDVARQLALTAYAALAPYESSVAAELPQLYAAMTPAERNLAPAVYDAMVRTGTADLRGTLGDEEAPVYNRMRAAEALFEVGDAGAITDTLRKTESMEVATLLAGMKVAQDGDVEGLRALHAEEKNPDKRKFYETQIDVWSVVER